MQKITDLSQHARTQVEKWLEAEILPGQYWEGELELNPAPTALYFLFCTALALPVSPEIAQKGVNYLLSKQNADGGWSPYPPAPSHFSTTLECYLGLRVRGHAPDHPSCQKALEFLEASLTSRMTSRKLFRSTEYWLGILGVLPWNTVFKPPIELCMPPLSLALDRTAYWVRTVSVPMALLGTCENMPAHAHATQLQDELRRVLAKPSTSKDSLQQSLLNQLKTGITQVAQYPLARSLAETLKEAAIVQALKRIDGITEKNGDIGGNPFACFFTLLAYDRLGLRSQPEYQQKFEQALTALMGYAVETETQWRLQTNKSTIWDTAFTLSALPASPVPRTESAAWLLSQQITEVRGEWSHNVTEEPGGWSFGIGHDHYPVTDCTATALIALHKHLPQFKNSPEATRAIRWLCGMQSPDGGWAAYEKHTLPATGILESLIPFEDIPSHVFDHPKADVTAKVVEALSIWRDSDTKIEETLRKARRFLLSTRESSGLWKGNYGVNYLYGTAFCCRALGTLDGHPSREWADAPQRFLIESQNPDGGWGETEASYQDAQLRGRGPSTSVQTAWALLGLCACGDDSVELREAVKAGLEYLTRTQQPSGVWDVAPHLGMVFPGTVSFRYQYYPAYFPLLALTAALERLQGWK